MDTQEKEKIGIAVLGEPYKKPQIEIIEMEPEGILCASGNGNDYQGGGGSDWN